VVTSILPGWSRCGG